MRGGENGGEKGEEGERNRGMLALCQGVSI